MTTKMQIARAKPKRHVRSEVDQILTHLKPLDLNILRWLLRYPFSRVEDVSLALVRVENPVRKHGRSRPLNDATVYRHVEFLREHDLVESVIAPGLGKKRCALYHLSNLGIHVLAANMHPPRSVTALARRCHTDEQGLLKLLPRLAQLVTLQNLINGIDTLAPTKLTFKGKSTRVWWSNVRDYRHPFFYRERPQVAAADAGIVLQVRPPLIENVQYSDDWYSLFVFLDSGLQSIDLITSQLRSIIYYRECPERWAGKQSYYDDFPLVLVLTTTKHRVEYWQNQAKLLSQQSNTDGLVGAIISQEEIDDKKNIHRFPWELGWKPLFLNKKTQADPLNASMRRTQGIPLKDLLHPIPPEAIPPGMLLPHEWHHLDLDEESLPASMAKLADRPISQVIEGNFMQRAEQLRTHRVQSRNKQEHIALLGLSLTQRQHTLLQFILDCPMASTADIAGLLNLKQVSVDRYIRDLNVQGYLDLVDTQRYQQEIRTWAPKEIRNELVVKDDIGKRWQLSEQGMQVLAASQHFSVHAIAIEKDEALRKRDPREGEKAVQAPNQTVENEHPPLIQRASIGLFTQRRVEHQSGIYSFFVNLQQAGQEENDRLYQIHQKQQMQLQKENKHALLEKFVPRYELCRWEMGVFTARRYQHLDKLHNLRPDAVAEYRYGGKDDAKTLLFWLEWDRNTMGTSDLKEKFANYLYYLGSREYQVHDKSILPWILAVVPEADQEKRLAEVAVKKFEQFNGLHLRLTTTTWLKNKGALGEIWLPILPTSSSNSQRRRRYRFFEGVGIS